MSIEVYILIAAAAFTVASLVARVASPATQEEVGQLNNLIALEHEQSERDKAKLSREDKILLKNLSTRLGKAGFYSEKQRRLACYAAALLYTAASSAALYLSQAAFPFALFALAGSIYLATLIWFSFLKLRGKLMERRIMFQTPLVIESMILLVESGLGILPALQEIVSANNKKHRGPVVQLLKLVYNLSANGVPFSRALEMVADAIDQRVLRHVLYHLDITGSEGGELIPALRSLGEHAHNEWRLSVRTRVRKLENAVVFPMFVSIMGLMCLVAAVPIVPLLDMADSLEGRQEVFQKAASKSGR